MANRNVRIVQKQGKKPNIMHLAKKASTLFDEDSLVKFVSGVLNPSADNDTQCLGIIREEIAATDSDYASATTKQVEVIYPGDIVEIDTTATVTIGTSYGISNAYTVDQSDTTNKIFTPTKVISSTRARGFFKNLAGDAVT